MSDSTNYKPLQVLTIKDIAFITGLSEPTSKQIYGDIKRDNAITRVTFTHLQRYFKV